MNLKSDPDIQIQDTVTYVGDPRVEAVLAAPPIATEAVRLYGFSEKLETPVLSALFGAFVRKAGNIIEAHHGDLFHDVRWLEHLTGPCEFLWGARQYGTDIGYLAKVQIALNPRPSSAALTYRVTLENRSRVWWARFDTLNYGSAAR